MRVYVGTTVEGLQALRDNGFPGPLEAHAVTGALREWYAEGDGDELEYAASSAAAQQSLRVLTSPPRRIVVAAEVPDKSVRPGADADRPALVVVRDTVTLAQVVSVHVDDELAEDDVAAAVQALPAADGGDDDAGFLVDGAEGHELLWYDVTELDDVLAGLLHRR